MARDVDALDLQKLKVLLRRFDKDHTGTLSRTQFEGILRSTLPATETVSRDDMDHMWSKFPKREDGDAEYDDFIKWILKPSTPLSVTPLGELVFFDLKAALEPLFWAYDQNHDGVIGLEEFMQAHGILQNALRLNPAKGGDVDPAVLKGDLQHCYLGIGHEGERRLTFAKFITWQRDALMFSSLPPDLLAKTLKSVAKQLERVFKLSELEMRGELSISDKQVLLRILSHLAQFSRELWGQSGSQRAPTLAHNFANKWSAPVVGMDVKHLKEVFLHDFETSRLKFTARVVSHEWEVICVPAIPMPHRPRVWLAKMQLFSNLSDGRQRSSGWQFYRYQPELFTWTLTEPEAFDAALEGLSPELQVFCLLKTMANFGLRLTWPDLQKALNQAVDLHAITEEQRRLCIAAFEQMVAKGLDAEGLYFGRERLEKVCHALTTSPSHVMGIFAL
ncbi:CML25 [Symbiodinium pilosum]|uniref:CML25 protein n=1 Tax=Symbiodinium pilosum TaxID=2952 RepID=A0A812YCJ1_SYMPI|nr:CML25 [Symbiodinium pilosum]